MATATLFAALAPLRPSHAAVLNQQDIPATSTPPATAPELPTSPGAITVPRDKGGPVAPGDFIDFQADELLYENNSEVVTATGSVALARDAWKLKADKIEYNRNTGVVIATGNVISIDPQGNQAIGDRVELTDSLRDGAIDNILLVLNDGGRLAANQAQRIGDVITLSRAVYSPCAVVDNQGCPHAPVWQIKGVRISYNRARHRIYYRKASLEMFGVPILYLPTFSHPDGEAKQVSGLLLPGISYQRQLGFGVSLPYHLAQAPDRDLTITPHVYTSENPALQVQTRRLFPQGPVQVDAFFTYAQLIDYAPDGVTQIDQGNKFRGYLGIKGQFQHSPTWRSRFSIRLTTDDTFNRRYGLDYDDTLRSTYALERLTANSYLSISAWGFQGLRLTDRPGEIPFVLPLVEYDWRPTVTVLGGRFKVGANLINLDRTDGQIVQRGLAYGRWDRSFITTLGQRVTATAMLRGDLYYVSNPSKATLPQYAGQSGLQARAIPLAAIDIEWPFAGPALGGNQTITPRVQVVSTAARLNGNIPNEDSRAIELDDASLFDLNRFPGYDRFETGTRVTYGVEYSLLRPGWAFRGEVGQSVRLAGDGNEFPQGTGLSDTVSDFTGRLNLKINDLFEVTHRFRIDRNTLAIRRNEIDVSIGSRRTYATVGYVKLNRNIQLEDLEDRSELRVGGRVALSRFWSAFGSGIFDLTSKAENPNATGNGFAAIRHRAGIEYEDECFRIGIGWRRDYISDRDFRAGNTFLITLAFKTLGH